MADPTPQVTPPITHKEYLRAALYPAGMIAAATIGGFALLPAVIIGGGGAYVINRFLLNKKK